MTRNEWRQRSSRPLRRNTFPLVRRLRCEPLEDRRLLAVFTVSNLDDGPVAAAGDLPGSLRQAIFDADALPGDDTIQFSAVGTINLTAGQLTIGDDLTVDGPGADQLTIDAGGTSRVMAITSPTTANISGLTLRDGSKITSAFSDYWGDVVKL